MRNKHMMGMIQPQQNSGDEDDDKNQKTPFLTIVRKDDRLQVNVRGEFPSPETCTQELATIYAMADEYCTVEVIINSPGGYVSTLAELISALREYGTVITIATGNVASAGFSLWAIGDIRVIQDFCWMMAHRESYGHFGKTGNHKDLAAYNDELFGDMLEQCCSDVLTPDQIETAKHTEVYVKATTLIETGKAIRWQEYRARQEAEVQTMPMVIFGGRMFILEDDGMMRPVKDISVGEETYTQSEVRYLMEFEPDDEDDEMDDEEYDRLMELVEQQEDSKPRKKKSKAKKKAEDEA